MPGVSRALAVEAPAPMQREHGGDRHQGWGRDRDGLAVRLLRGEAP
jgi:hypothetical protein